MLYAGQKRGGAHQDLLVIGCHFRMTILEPRHKHALPERGPGRITRTDLDALYRPRGSHDYDKSRSIHVHIVVRTMQISHDYSAVISRVGVSFCWDM